MKDIIFKYLKHKYLKSFVIQKVLMEVSMQYRFLYQIRKGRKEGKEICSPQIISIQESKYLHISYW